METRNVVAAGVVVLALAACLGHRSAVVRPAVVGSAVEAPRRVEAARRSPSFLLPASRTPRAAAAAPATAEPALGAWTVEDALEGLRRPDLDDEVSVLRDAQPGVPAEAAEVLALAATDRGYHDALARASEAAAGGRSEQALTALEGALAEAPAAHRVARVRVLEAMVALARSVRGLAERRALAARLADERAGLLEVAARAGIVDADGAARARRAGAGGRDRGRAGSGGRRDGARDGIAAGGRGRLTRARSGALLVMLALGLASALGVLAFALSWSSTAGYGLAHLDAARVRLDAAQSTLGEAASLAIEGAIGDDAPPELRDLRDRLYDELIRALETARFGIPLTDHIVVEAAVPPGRIAGLALPSGDVALEALTFRLHGFRPVAYGDGSAFASPKVFYHESMFHDDSKDSLPRDFAGYLTVELTVAARERGRTARRTFRATRDAKVLDVAPPAREFGLFSYGVPPDKEYMLNDLNSGGRFTLYAKGARAFVRGPLFLKVEDAADPVHVGGDFRQRASASYPERGRDWHGWAFIPGPRSVHMSNFTGDAREMMGRLAGMLGAEGVSARPRRPPATEDRATFSFLGLQAPGVALIGPALSPALGIFHPIPASEQIACANPWVYLTGVVPPGKQLFSLAGSPDGVGEVTPGTRTTIFDGLMSRRGGKVKEIYREGLRLPHEVYATGQRVEDGDAVHPEPFGYETVEKTGKEKPLDQGIYGIYKIAEFKREPVLSAQVLDLLSTFWLPAKGLVLGAEAILRQMGMIPDLWIILVHWGTKTARDLPEKLDPEFLTSALDKKDYFIAPYGLYYESPRNRELVLEAATVLMGAGFSLTARRLEQAAMKKFFRAKPEDAPLMGDKAVAALKDRVFAQKLPRHAEKAADMTHGALRWMAENFLFEEVRNVVKSIVSSIFSGAMEGFAFVAAWKAVGYMRLRHLRAALGDIAKWEPPPSQADLAQEFPKGLYPPKYRPYQRVATRIYGTFHEMLERHTIDGELRLDEIVLVRTLSYRSATPIRYRGRGVIVALGGTAGTEPLLDAPVVRADPASYLTLVVEDLSEDALVKSRAGTVALGPVFHGTVYASSGARPAGERTLILGNLVTIHLRKSRIAADARLDVVYDADRLPLDRDAGGRKEWWRLSVSPRSAGLED